MSRTDEARYGKACILVLNVCPFTLRHVIDDYITRHGSLSLFDFLEKNKHDLFHLYAKRCCCKRQSRSVTPMYKSQWESLFMGNTSSCPKGVTFNCSCKYNAKPGITTDAMDVTMCCLVINNICPGVNVAEVNTIREMRIKLIHSPRGHLDQLKFNDYWNKVKTALLNLASHVSPSVHTDTLSMIDELHKRIMNPDELGELRNLVMDEKRIKYLEKSVTNLTITMGETTNRLARTRVKLEHTRNEMEQAKDGLAQTRYELAETRDGLVQNKDELTQATNGLVQTRVELAKTIDGLAQNRDELTQTRDELSQTRVELAETRDGLVQNRDELTQTRDELSQTRYELAETRDGLVQNRDELTQTIDGLAQTRVELAETRDGLVQNRDELTQTRVELAETRDGLVQTIVELAKTADGVVQNRDELTQTRDELSQTRDELAETRDGLVQNKDEFAETRDGLVQTRVELAKTIDGLAQNRDELTKTTDRLAQTTVKVSLLEDHLTQNENQTQRKMSRLETTVGDHDHKLRQIRHEVLYTREDKVQKGGKKLDIKDLSEKLVEINNDTTKVIPLSNLQERGEKELPIELLYASVVILRDLNFSEKGHNSDSATTKPRSIGDYLKTFIQRLPSSMSSGGTGDGTPRDIREVTGTSDGTPRDRREVTEPGDIFPPRGKVARDVYMLGGAAHGKTTYCLWLLKKWCNAKIGKMRLDKWEKAIKEFHFVFLIQFRHVNPNRASVVDMICQDVFRRDKRCHATIRHVLSSDKYRSLIIMDGLDEWNPNEETRKQLTCQGMPNIEEVSSTVSCFFSMRPWVFPTILKSIKVRDRVVEIKGLSETGIMDVVKNVLINHYKLDQNSSEYECTYHKIAKHLEEKSLKSFMQIPLLAVVCVQIWYEGKQVGDSMTSFYSEMLNMLIERANQKHEIRIENEKDCELPEVLSEKLQIRKPTSLLLKLGKIACRGMLSNETNLEFQKAEIEKEIGVRELQYTLDVGLFIQKEASSLTTKNVSVHFFHKSIQEFLAAIHIVTNKEIGDSLCKHLSSVNIIMELSNVIMFICGMCPCLDPCLGSDISRRVVSVTDGDTEICKYRESPDYNRIVEELYKLQVSWIRELQYGQLDRPVTDIPMAFYVSDVYLNVYSDTETMRLTRDILSDHRVYIRSLRLDRVPTHGQRGITNTELNDFLFNKHKNTKSLVMAFINDSLKPVGTKNILKPIDRTLHGICIPSLRCLHLERVKFSNTSSDSKVFPPLLTDMTSLCELKLSYITLGDRGLGLSDMTSLCRLRLINVKLGNSGLDLSANMIHLDKVRLSGIDMSERQWRQFILSVLNMKKELDIELIITNIDEESKAKIRSSTDFCVTRDRLFDIYFTRLLPLSHTTE